jgi:hypothetical protein
MAQKANLTLVNDKYEADRLETERRDREIHARLAADLVDALRLSDLVPTAEHQQGLSFWQAIKTMFK